jgi:soluble lytic murein transglycosylase-like protein
MIRRKYGFLPTSEKGLSAENFVGIIVIVAFVALLAYNMGSGTTPQTPPEATQYAVKDDCTKVDTICLIHKYAAKNGVELETALRIATCESQLGLYKYNKSGSTAKGVYQFIDSTWEYTGGGDVLDDEQNIQRFMQFYSTHPEWWECK